MSHRYKAEKLWLALAFIAAIRLIWEAVPHSTDLHVYWRTAHWWLNGISPFAFDPGDRANVFKYPPWTVPLFLPLGFISFDLTRWVWVILELLSILYAIRWLTRAGVNRNVTYAVAALYWWTWKGHIYSGQFTLFILAAALWAVPPEETREISPVKASLLSIVISSKVYSIFTLFGILRTLLRPRTIFIALSAVVLLEAVVFGVLRAHGNMISFMALHRDWILAAESGGAELGAHVVRGQGNHSLTAGILRWFRINPLDTSKDGYVALVMGCIFAPVWHFLSKNLDRAEKWAGWIGVGMIIHPLLWHHSFVLAFPICALAMDRAIRSGRRSLIVWAGLATFFIAILIPNIFGMTIVTPFELASSKSWGVVIAAAVLVACRRQAQAITFEMVS